MQVLVLWRGGTNPGSFSTDITRQSQATAKRL